MLLIIADSHIILNSNQSKMSKINKNSKKEKVQLATSTLEEILRERRIQDKTIRKKLWNCYFYPDSKLS